MKIVLQSNVKNCLKAAALIGAVNCIISISASRL
jgi:hypothetical protein